MALLNLALVSDTLKNFIKLYFEASDEWTDVDRPEVSVKPPDLLPSNSLGIYLYHISEDNHYKNLPSEGNDVPHVRYVPMGLNLYYQLTAKGTLSASDDTGTLKEQKMIGLAVKALHDYPMIDDSTVITNSHGNGQKVFTSDLKGTNNRFRITLQPVAFNESVSYWTAGNAPQRLAVYYKVSVILLEPEEVRSRSGRVLTYGVNTFLEGPPHISSCKNTLSFSIPGEAETREVELRPAQASPAETPLPALVLTDHKVSFMGTGFNTGSATLLLMNEHWDEPVVVDPSWWQISITKDGLNAVIRETTSSGGSVIIPGMYSAVVKVIKKIALPDGTTRSVEQLSNQCPFAISPRIDEIDQGNPVSTTVTISGYSFTGEISVYISDRKLKAVTGSPNAGEFEIVSTTQLIVKLPASDLNGNLYSHGISLPIRIFVNGAESPPNWIKYP